MGAPSARSATAGAHGSSSAELRASCGTRHWLPLLLLPLSAHACAAARSARRSGAASGASSRWAAARQR
eukprot:scaffold132207_cov63-Phaeocystis_antarctica.AAC.3